MPCRYVLLDLAYMQVWMLVAVCLLIVMPVGGLGWWEWTAAEGAAVAVDLCVWDILWGVGEQWDGRVEHAYL
jgi:hypothetical protein